eukprot:1146522-Pelagomonas_calceolata.AAC.4
MEQGIEVPENISRAIPDWAFHNGTGSDAFVRFIPGRSAQLDPTKIPPQDRDIHLVELKSCPDIKPFPTMEAATAQHGNQAQNLQLKKPKQEQQGDLANHLSWCGRHYSYRLHH